MTELSTPRMLDLSVGLADGMVRYPSPYLPDVGVRPAATHEEHARSAQVLTFGSHTSTHLDAPFHACPDGLTIDRIPLETVCGPARILRLPGHTREKPVDVADLQGIDWLANCRKLVLDTGWASATWGGAAYFRDGPYLTRAAAEFLADLPNLHLLGMDFPNIDAVEDMKMGVPAPIHRIILGKGIVLLENLVNLEQVEDRFLLLSQPIRVEGGDGCPTRAVAVFPLSEAAAWAGGSDD